MCTGSNHIEKKEKLELSEIEHEKSTPLSKKLEPFEIDPEKRTSLRVQVRLELDHRKRGVRTPRLIGWMKKLLRG